MRFFEILAIICLICWLDSVNGYACSIEEGLDYAGDVIGTTSASNAQDCCQKCGANSKCSGWSFDNRNPRNGGTRSCWLKRNMNPRLPIEKSSITSGFRGLSSNFTFGKGLTGGSNYEIFRAASFQGCAHACQMSIPCIGWAWNSWDSGSAPNFCFLKKGGIRSFNEFYTVSGYYLEPAQPKAYEYLSRSECRWSMNKLYESSIITKVYFRSSKECCGACVLTPGCSTWTYNTTMQSNRRDRTCILSRSLRSKASSRKISSNVTCGCPDNMPTYEQRTSQPTKKKDSSSRPTNGRKRMNQASIDMLKGWEGWRPCPYQDAVGYWTIGYGHLLGTGAGNRNHKCLSEAEGEALLRQDVKRFEDCVNGHISRPMTCNQFGAMVDLAYNIGCGGFQSGNINGAAQAFMNHIYAGGRVLEGLRRRRVQDKTLFETAGGSPC